MEIDGIVGPIRIVETSAYNPLIFCVYGFTNECIKEDGSHIEPRCCEFGEHAVVITDVKKFYQTIGDAFKKVGNGTIKAQLVEYVSYDEHHGEMGPFRKYDDFSHQSEFRFAYEDKNLDPTYTLEIGSLEGVATLCPSDQANSLLEVNA